MAANDVRVWVYILIATASMRVCGARNASIGILVPLRWSADSDINPSDMRYAASAAMAAFHVNNKVCSLILNCDKLLPADFTLGYDIKDSMAMPTVAVDHAVAWNKEGREAIVGSSRTAVTGPLALVASIEATPVIAWAATGSALSDKDVYPLLSRTTVSDAAQAKMNVHFIASMGWTRVAVLHVDDAWGRGYLQDLSAATAALGISIDVSAPFALGNRAQMEEAVEQVSRAGVRLILCAVFDTDLEALTDAADNHGMLTTGYVWISLTENGVSDVIDQSHDPQRTQERLTGWMISMLDPLHGDRSKTFQEALTSEPLEHLNSGILQDLTQATIAGPCDQYCASIYDAVWTAAIAIGRVQAEDGSVDKHALLGAIRNVSFVGASGEVGFDAVGDRDPSGLPLILKNLRPANNSDGSVSLVPVPTWTFQSGELKRESSSPPVWLGGHQGWTLPFSELDCDGDYLFSPSTLQCEPCPIGSEKDGGACVAYNASVGVLLPLRWWDPAGDLQLWVLRYAAAVTMAAHHINNRLSVLVPGASELLPPGFKLVYDIQNSLAQPTTAVDRAVSWNKEGRHAIVGSYLSKVTEALALAASIEGTPVVSYGATAPTLSNREMYPTFSRTIFSDPVLADRMVRSFQRLGWRRIATLYVNDAWGRGVSQEITSAASRLGMEMVGAADFEFDDEQSIGNAVAFLSSVQARVSVLVCYSSDVIHVSAAAEHHGMLDDGHAWVAVGDAPLILWEVSAAAERDKVAARLTGWLVVYVDALHGDRGAVFQRALETEAASNHLAADKDVFEGRLTEAIADGVCDQYCGTIYDAVWAAAIAISRTEVADDGSVDHWKVQAAMDEVAFEGATGWVQLDSETGERVAAEVPLLVSNLRIQAKRLDDGGNSIPELAAVLTWKWSGGSADGRLEQHSEQPPVWPGGGVSWTVPPASVGCAAGSVFDAASTSCTPCQPGTAQVEHACKPCEPGHYAADEAMSTCLPCGTLGFANESGMTHCFACPANRNIPSSVQSSKSIDDCQCPGLVFGCRFRISETLLIAVAVVSIPLALFCARWVLCRSTRQDSETLLIQARTHDIRAQLGIRREDGFLLSGEARTWFQTLRFAHTTQLSSNYLDNLARLTLMLPFEIEAVDMLAGQLYILNDRRNRDVMVATTREHSMEVEASVTGGGGGTSPLHSIFGGHLAASSMHHTTLGHAEQCHALSALVLEVSTWLLDPGEAGSSESKTHMSSKTGLVPPPVRARSFGRESSQDDSSVQQASPLSRALSVRSTRRAPGEFVRPSQESAAARFAFFQDRVAKLQLWSQGDNFMHLKAAVQVWMDSLRVAMDDVFASIQEQGRAELLEFGVADTAHGGEKIHRQDHHMVRAIRVDEQSLLEFELQLPPDNHHDPTLANPVVDPDSEEGSTGGQGPQEAAAGLPVVLSVESELRVTVESVATTTTDASPPPAAVATSGRSDGWENLLRRSVSESDLRLVSEGAFIHQLSLRAALLDREFQAAVRVAFAGATGLSGGAARVTPAPIKTQARMSEKVKEYAKMAASHPTHQQLLPLTAHILDPVRCSLVCSNSSSILQHAEWLVEHGESVGLPVVRTKNKFAVKDSSEYDGYRDLMLSVLYTGSKGLCIIGEIQLHDARMHPLKIKMHRLYKVKRAEAATSL